MDETTTFAAFVGVQYDRCDLESERLDIKSIHMATGADDLGKESSVVSVANRGINRGISGVRKCLSFSWACSTSRMF